MNRHFLREEIQMDNKFMKKMFYKVNYYGDSSKILQ
jgi:hypothetical protein